MDFEEENKYWKEQNRKIVEDRRKRNEQLLTLPIGLSAVEEKAYREIINLMLSSVDYALTDIDAELIWQFCQLRVMRDRAWKEYNVNPNRYIRIVTGICNDGKTPKVMVKENEHYKTLQDCNKQLEKILKDLRLTPEIRNKKK